MSSVDYSLLANQLQALLKDETHPITNMSQFSAFVFHQLPNLNWAGFYLAQADKTLRLGPFQGQVACTLIGYGKGVCGTAFKENRILRVSNVHEFDGHIACDSRSQSEIVLPVVKGDVALGVFDIDSPILDRFDQADEDGISRLVSVFTELTDFSKLVV